MRKILFILFTCVFLSVNAQVGEHRDNLAVGFNAGYVMSKVGFNPSVPQVQKPGFTGGLTLRYTSEKYFKSICSIQFELNYCRTGWKEKIQDVKNQPVINQQTKLPEQFEHTINYVQMPVLARMGWGREQKGCQFYFLAGPQFGYYINESTSKNFEINQRNTFDRVSSVIAQDTMSVENKLDYGIAAGLGLEYSVPNAGHIMLEGRYYYGLGDLYGNSKKDYFGRSNIGSIIVKLTYLFDIKKSKTKKK